jgi:hypothetical protein
MAKRGRVSAAELAISGPVEVMERPDAPYDLTDEQSDEWWAIVNRLPADWFPRETHATLADYCRHVVKSRRIAQLVAAEERKKTVDVDVLDKLYKMAERESRAASSLATRMRITQQTTYDKSRKKPVEASNPWDFGKQG